MEVDDLERVDWSRRVQELHKVYDGVTKKKTKKAKKSKKPKKPKVKKEKKTKRRASKKK